jgi:hypothetical protein
VLWGWGGQITELLGLHLPAITKVIVLERVAMPAKQALEPLGELAGVASGESSPSFLDFMLADQRAERIALGYGVLIALMLVYVVGGLSPPRGGTWCAGASCSSHRAFSCTPCTHHAS